jgi:hypothetical protein
MSDHARDLEDRLARETPETIIFESCLPYCTERIRAAAIYCSDGRFGSHCDDFLLNCLQLPRYDRLIIPGGPGNLAGHFMTHRENDALANQLEFLTEVHGLERVVLIAHEGCAFYSRRLLISPRDVPARQQEDLRRAAERVRSIASRLTVQAYMASRINERIVFESMPVEQPRSGLARTVWL